MLKREQINEALFDDAAFDDIVNFLPSSHGARSVLINFAHADGDAFNLSHRHFSDAFMRDYQAHFITEDPWLMLAMRKDRFNTTFNVSETLSHKRYEGSRMYNDLVRRHGDDTYHCIGGTFVTDWGVGAVSIQRGKSGQAFTAQDVNLLEQEVASISRLLMVRGEIAAHKRQSDIARSVMDIVGIPAITVRRDLAIAHANLAAEDVLRERSGLYVEAGQLVAHMHSDRQSLALAVEMATAPFQPTSSTLTIRRFSLLDQSPLPPYRTTITPVPKLTGASHALILFRDPNAMDLSLIDRVRGLYRLTQAEAELAVALSTGLSLAQIASARAVRDSTIRSQVKSIASKMGCSRQSEIAVRVEKIPPLWTDHPFHFDSR